jgi:hypothetical protein
VWLFTKWLPLIETLPDRKVMDMTHEAHQTVSVSWDETIPGVIRYTMEPRWTLADLQRALTVGFEMQRASTFQTVHIVFDTQKTTMVPTGIISVARRIFRQCPSKTPLKKGHFAGFLSH